jgi:thiol-disulfide isomerase/thioredoxin
MRNRIAILVAAGLLAMALEPAGCTPPAPPPPKSPEIQAAYWLNSGALTLAQLRGKVVVLEFFATWCPVCNDSMPGLIDLHKQYAGQGVVFIGLTKEAQDVVQPYVQNMGIPYAVGGGSQSVHEYGVREIPKMCIFDPDGTAVWRGHPMDPKFTATLQQVVAKTRSGA